MENLVIPWTRKAAYFRKKKKEKLKLASLQKDKRERIRTECVLHTTTFSNARPRVDAKRGGQGVDVEGPPTEKGRITCSGSGDCPTEVPSI